MSPEQARGAEDVDAATDVWSFCVVLYECLSGRLPFESENYNALMREIIEETPPTLAELGASDLRLSSIVDIGMAKDPDRRWPSMKALGVSLAEWLVERGLDEDATLKPLGSAWGLGGARPAARGVAVSKIERHSAPAPANRRTIFLGVGAALAAVAVIVGYDSEETSSPTKPPREIVAPTRPIQTAAVARPETSNVVPVPSAATANPDSVVDAATSSVPKRPTAPRVPSAAIRPPAVPAASTRNENPLDLVEPY
jgi:serine/threonine-protein kinase